MLVLFLLAGPSGAAADHERGRGRPDFLEPQIVVDVDALGLIEGWWAHEPASSASSAHVTSSGAQLLFFCGPWEALHVTVEPGFGGGPSGFGCPAGDALFALDQGGLACRRYGANSDAPPAGPATIVIDDPAGGQTLAGECVGPTGFVVPARIAPELLAGHPAEPTPPCNRSSVTFRGQVTAGGC